MAKRSPLVIFALHAARLTGRAVALSASTMIGYAAATYVIFFRMHAQTGFQSDYVAAVEKGERFAVPTYMHLLWLRTFALEDMSYRFTPSSRYPNFIAHYSFEPNPHYSALYSFAVQTLIPIFCAVSVALFASQFTPLWLGPGGLTRTPTALRPVINCAWTLALRDTPMRWGLLLCAAATIGFSAAILGEAYAIVQTYWWGDMAWENGGPATNVVRPFFALFTPPDAAWLLLGSFLLAAGSVIVTARDRLMRDKAMIAGWCFCCGYPRAAPSRPDELAASVPLLCPECGKPPGAHKQRLGIRHAKLAIATVLILSVVAYFVVPCIILAL